jgi:dUTP pyrophosphatase
MSAEKLNVNVEIVEGGKFPTLGTKGSGAVDLYARLDDGGAITLLPGQTKMIPLGIKTEIPEGYVGLLFARSGLAKDGIAPANKVGVVDSDYRGEWMMAAYNHGHERKIIYNGDRVAQMMIIESKPLTFTQVESVNSTERGEGGFGSTGA